MVQPMSEADAGTPYDASAEDALGAIETHDGPVIVDLDETLFLRNSTGEFLDSARPSLLAYLLIKVVDLAKPWRWTGSGSTRDTWRVRAVLMCMPWTLPLWRRQAISAAAKDINRPLAESLRAHSMRSDADLVVSTLGFVPIVAPLVKGFGLPGVKIVAMNPWNGDDQRRGKLALTQQAMGAEAVADAAVITDSTADLELLAAAKVPLRVVWPEARPTYIFNGIYVPGRYVSVVKRPGSSYVRRKIIQEDLVLWILGSVWVASNPLAHVVGLCLLAMSFWAAYEIGYIDNDRIADRYEKDPQLSDAFRERLVDVPQWKPAVWALGTGVLGLWIIRWREAPAVTDYLAWATVLAALLTIFALYNRLDKKTRIFLFPLLQLLRTAAFVAVVPITSVAAVAFVVHVLVRWVPYYLYRVNDGRWVATDLTVVRLILFVSGALLLASDGAWSDLVSPAVLLLFAWHLVLARRQLREVVSDARRIDS